MYERELQLMFFGDDLVCGRGDESGLGWVGRITQLVVKQEPHSLFYNLGIRGETSTQLCERFEQEASLRTRDDADTRILFNFGLNDSLTEDLNPQVALKDSLENMKQLMRACKGKYRMLVVGPPCVYNPNHNAKVKKLHQWLEDLCGKTHTPYISLFEATEQDPQYKRELLHHGRMLPSRKGYEKLFDLISNDRQWWFPA